jgi:hypothetical protein
MATNGELIKKRGKSRIMTRRDMRAPLPQPQELGGRRTFSRLEVCKKQEYVDGNQVVDGEGRCGKGSLTNTFSDIAHGTTTSLPTTPPKSADLEDWIRLANVDDEAPTRAAGCRARVAEGVVMESGVVGPINSTRRKRAKQTSAPSAEVPQ